MITDYKVEFQESYDLIELLRQSLRSKLNDKTGKEEKSWYSIVKLCDKLALKVSNCENRLKQLSATEQSLILNNLTESEINKTEDEYAIHRRNAQNKLLTKYSEFVEKEKEILETNQNKHIPQQSLFFYSTQYFVKPVLIQKLEFIKSNIINDTSLSVPLKLRYFLEKWFLELQTTDLANSAMSDNHNNNNDKCNNEENIFNLKKQSIFNISYLIDDHQIQLSFSTQNCGAFNHITIILQHKYLVRRNNEEDDNNKLYFEFQSDIFLNNLQTIGNEYLLGNRLVTDFIHEIIWKST